MLAERPDAILYPTVGFGGDIVERYAHIPLLAEAGAIRMSLFDSGSVNLGGIGDDGLPGGGFDFVYANSFGDVRHMAALCERYRLGPSIAIFEPGFLRTVLAYCRAGRLPRGTFVKFYFGGDFDYLGGAARGVSFGLPPTPTALEAYLELLDDCDRAVGGGGDRRRRRRVGHGAPGARARRPPARRPRGLRRRRASRATSSWWTKRPRWCAPVGRAVADSAQAAAMLGLEPPSDADYVAAGLSPPPLDHVGAGAGGGG